MLIACKECGGQISDKAYMCPHCGYPTTKKPPSKRNTRKRQRLPNGFGQITEIKNKNLRKPFRAMVTVGKTETGRPICKILQPEGYFKTYQEAYMALVKYNADPYEIADKFTMQDLYKAWSERHFKRIKPQSQAWIKIAWDKCENISKLKVREVRIRHLKMFLESLECKRTSKLDVKNVLNMMFDYAVEYELTDKNYARAFGLDKTLSKDIEKNKKAHISFTEDEMKILWANISYENVDMLLIQCYTGLRPLELMTLKLDNVDLEKNIIICGMKTEAGENRIIPIHSAIRDLVVARYEGSKKRGLDFLFITKEDAPFTPQKNRTSFYRIIREFNMNPLHRPHDPRKQFVTMAKKADMDEYALKKIVGHKITDITEAIYTDRDYTWLAEEIEKIKVYE